MDTPMRKQQKEFYIMPTKTLLEHKSTISPEDASTLFFHGLSLDQFIIAGSWPIEFLASLKGHFNLIYCILLSPIALIIRKYYERKVFFTMKHYQPFKMPTPPQRLQSNQVGTPSRHTLAS